MKRRLTLHRDHLGELSSNELAAVAGGTNDTCVNCGDVTATCTWTCPTLPLIWCVSIDLGWDCAQPR